MGKINVHGFK